MNATTKAVAGQATEDCTPFDTLEEAITFAKANKRSFIVQSPANGGHGGAMKFWVELGMRSPFLRNFERIAWKHGKVVAE